MKRNKVVEYIKPHLKLYFSGGSVVKNLPVNVGDMGSIPGSGRSPEEEMASHSSILAWTISWTEELGWLWGHKESDVTEHSCTPI